MSDEVQPRPSGDGDVKSPLRLHSHTQRILRAGAARWKSLSLVTRAALRAWARAAAKQFGGPESCHSCASRRHSRETRPRANGEREEFPPSTVIAAKLLLRECGGAGIQIPSERRRRWMPACAGMTLTRSLSRSLSTADARVRGHDTAACSSQHLTVITNSGVARSRVAQSWSSTLRFFVVPNQRAAPMHRGATLANPASSNPKDFEVDVPEKAIRSPVPGAGRRGRMDRGPRGGTTAPAGGAPARWLYVAPV